MSFKQREQKRMKRIASERASREARNAGTSAVRWYLTLATYPIGCARCPTVLRVGHQMVYRARPREAICLLCAESLGIKPRPSLRWENRRKERRP